MAFRKLHALFKALEKSLTYFVASLADPRIFARAERDAILNLQPEMLNPLCKPCQLKLVAHGRAHLDREGLQLVR